MLGVLRRSADRKVTNLARLDGKSAAISNSFGLPSGKDYSCEFVTPTCAKVCYAGRIEKMMQAAKDLLVHNYETLKGATFEEQVLMLDAMINDFEKDCIKRGAERLFRIHWDGDFFSDQYTRAWSNTILNHPDTRFWVYTRNPFAAKFLHNQHHPNLSLYFSADKDNYKDAVLLRRKYGIRLAWLGSTFKEAQEAVRAITQGTAAKCPEQTKQIPLISVEGGACVKCRLCIKGEVDIAFSISKK